MKALEAEVYLVVWVRVETGSEKDEKFFAVFWSWRRSFTRSIGAIAVFVTIPAIAPAKASRWRYCPFKCEGEAEGARSTGVIGIEASVI